VTNYEQLNNPKDYFMKKKIYTFILVGAEKPTEQATVLVRIKGDTISQ
jgi:hypothetical protein